jgi:hypothetical protein
MDMKKNIGISLTALTLIIFGSSPSLLNAAKNTEFEPAWIRMDESPLKNATSSTISPFLVKIPPNSRISNHQSRIEIGLNYFAILHTNLLARLDRTYPILERTRDSLLVRIDAGRGDMTEPKELMLVAQNKIDSAKQYIEELRLYVPPTLYKAGVTATTTTSLVAARKLGEDAINAIKEAKTALQKVLISLAQVSEFELNAEGKIVPQDN